MPIFFFTSAAEALSDTLYFFSSGSTVLRGFLW